MKKILLTVALTVTGAVTALAANDADTLAKVEDASQLIITESPAGTAIKITRFQNGDSLTETITRNFDGPVTLNQRRWFSPISTRYPGYSSNWDLCMGGPGLGWTNACGQPDGTGIEMGKSLEISWLNMLSLKYTMPWKNSNISIGFGFDWRNYRISTSDVRFISTENGGITTGLYPEGAKGHGSRLKVFSMGIPVLWGQSIPVRTMDGSHFYMSVGAVFNYNSHGSLLTKWTDADGNEVKEKTNHIGQRRFSMDLIAIVKIGWGLNLYARYSPQTVLRGAGQLKFRPFSTGLILFY